MNTSTAILEVFYQAAGQFVQGDQLQRLTKCEAITLSQEIASLTKLGYTIESHPHFGYRLLGTPDRLTADDIQARFHTNVIGSEVLVFEETSSTNDVIEHMARTNRREGIVVFAESQTRGRGRHGRVWVSPPRKGLWFSVLLRPRLTPAALTRITVAASVAVARALRSTADVDARIKWPNDVTIGGKKLAGILCEMRGEADEIAYAILGIGIDVNCEGEDFPPEVAALATSLRLETGEPQDRTELAAKVLGELDALYAATQDDFDSVVSEWARLCTTLGKQIAVTTGARRVEGHAQALDGDGALLLRRDNGQIERIVGGDVIVERA